MKLRWVLFISVTLIVILGAAGWLWLFDDLPAWDSLPERLQTPSVRIEDRNGRLLYEALEDQGGRHVVVPIGSIPLACRQAAIATEDRRFYAHPGVDLQGVLRAAWINLRGGQALAGGSTITQQVARNLLLEDAERGERSLRRKLREAFLAWRLTSHYSKDEVLAYYLNQTYYGGMAYGLEAAAQTFFGKPVSVLDLAECAMLAGLPQAPAFYNPYTDLAAARHRQSIVLSLMEQDGYITTEQLQLAEREALILAEKPYPIEAPHFVMMVRSELDRLFSAQEIYQHGGLVVRTSLDLDWQKLAEAAVLHHLKQLERSEAGLGHNVNNAALVALDPHDGAILALVGSPDYFDGAHAGAINMALAPRQPGSAIKPLVYAAALDPSGPGGGWTAGTMLLDVSTSFVTHEGKAYTPANYDLREHGPVLVREALASSLNIPAVLTLQHVGMENFSNLAKKVGISTLGDPQTYDLSLALGGGEVRLIELTAAYAVFANRGYSVRPQFILEVQDFSGTQLYRPGMPLQVRLLDERLAWLISDILSDPEARRLGFGLNSLLRLDRPAAVKTGTTSNFHDNWTVGYTPDLVVGVWSGNTDYQPMRDVNGLSGAAPIWHQFMRSVLDDRPPQQFTRPPGLVQVEICRLSGLLPTQACPYRRLEWFIDGTQPVELDRFYQEVTVDLNTGKLASQATPPEQSLRRVALDLPPQAYPWARAQGLSLYADLISTALAGRSEQPSPEQSSSQIAPDQSLILLSPASGGIFRLSPTIEAGAQRIRLEAATDLGLTDVTLWVDEAQISRQDSAPFQAWWTLTPGVHRA
ncbi:MAG: penicillin-binding protein 1C, partial [Chloroflexi bacterium RBG_16_57_11]